MFRVTRKKGHLVPMSVVCKSIDDCNVFLDKLCETSKSLEKHNILRDSIQTTPIDECSLDTGGMMMLGTPFRSIVVSDFTFSLPTTRAASAMECIACAKERVQGWLRVHIWHEFVILPTSIKDELVSKLKEIKFEDETLNLSLDEQLILDDLEKENVIIRVKRID